MARSSHVMWNCDWLVQMEMLKSQYGAESKPESGQIEAWEPYSSLQHPQIFLPSHSTLALGNPPVLSRTCFFKKWEKIIPQALTHRAVRNMGVAHLCSISESEGRGAHKAGWGTGPGTAKSCRGAMNEHCSLSQDLPVPL